MNAVLGVLAARGLFFLDSRTSAESVGYKVALGLGVPAAERQVFLDGEATPEAIHDAVPAPARPGADPGLGDRHRPSPPRDPRRPRPRGAQGEGRGVRVRAGELSADAVGRGVGAEKGTKGQQGQQRHQGNHRPASAA